MRPGEVRREAGQVVGPLGHIGDHQPRAPPQQSGVLQFLPHEQPQQAGLARAVAPQQGDPVPLLHLEGAGGTYRAAAVAHGHLPPFQQADAGEGLGRQLQGVGVLHISQQGGFLLNGAALPVFQALGALHHLGGLVAYKAPVHLQSGVLAAVLAPLHPVGPALGAPGGLLQPPDLPFQLLVLGLLPPVPGLLLPEPHGEVPLDQLLPRRVQGQNVVHAPVQKGPVMGDQEEPPAQPPEIPGGQRPPRLVQVVGGLVDHGVAVLLKEQGGQPGPGLLPAAEAVKGPLQQLLPQPQLVQLPQELPLVLLRHSVHQHVTGGPLGVPDGLRHIEGPLRPDQGPLPLQTALQQTQQGGLAPSVPTHQAQLPIGVPLEVQAFKDRGVVPVVGEIQVLDQNLRHGHALLCQ